MIRRLRSYLAWRLFQARVRRARDDAQHKHARTREINARQMAVVNAALRAGR